MTESLNGNHYRMAEGLCGLLADTYLLYNTTQVAHWNIEGPHFEELQVQLEKQYRDLGAAVDRIAERMCELRIYVPGTLGDYICLSRLQQTPQRGFRKLIQQLIEGHEMVVRRIRRVLEISHEAGDDATAEVLAQRLRRHEMTLRSFQQGLFKRMGHDAGTSRQARLPFGRRDVRHRVTA